VGEAFDALEEGDEAREKEPGHSNEEVEDWELVHDDVTRTDFWWSESRQISKWAVDEEGSDGGDGRVEENVVDVAEDVGYASTEPEKDDEILQPAATTPVEQQKHPKGAENAPVLPDPAAVLYRGLSRDIELDESSFDENPTPDERLHTYEDEEDEMLRLSVAGFSPGATALPKKVEAAAVVTERDQEQEQEQDLDEDYEDEGSDTSSIDDWFIVHDDLSGRDYWWSDSREEAQWVDEIEEGAEDPHQYFAMHHQHHSKHAKKEKATASKLRKKSMVGEAWELHTDDDGREYLYNKATEESRWREA
jgi:hypothetical protein